MRLRSVLFAILFYGWTTLLSLVLLPVLLLPQRMVRRITLLWPWGTMHLLRLCCGIHWRIEGREHLGTGPVILACKHQSAWETLMLPLLVADTAFVLKRELARTPFVGWYLLRAGNIAVDREGGGAALKRMLREAQAVVADGRRIVIFPEGTRTAPGERRPYHAGIVALYQALDVPVVPVALNSGLFWSRRGMRMRPGTITLRFLPPLQPGMARKAFLQGLQERIESESDALAEGTGFMRTSEQG